MSIGALSQALATEPEHPASTTAPGQASSQPQAAATAADQQASSAKAPDALFKIGVCQLDKKQKDEARASWQKVVADYPNSSAANLAKARLDQLK